MHRVFNILRKRHCSTSKQYITYVPTTHKPTLLSHEHSKKETVCVSATTSSHECFKVTEMIKKTDNNKKIKTKTVAEDKPSKN